MIKRLLTWWHSFTLFKDHEARIKVLEALVVDLDKRLKTLEGK